MRRDARSLLFDVLAACEAIGRFAAGRSRNEYESDDLLRSACERKLEIIGEAMVRLREDHREVFDRIEAGNEIIGFRNRLIHGYDVIDSDVVWDVVSRKLVPLARETRSLLEST